MCLFLSLTPTPSLSIPLSFAHICTHSAPYLPWVLLCFSLLMGNPVETDLMGIMVGHIYFFFDRVYPKVADVRGWSWTRPMRLPHVLWGMLTQPGGAVVLGAGPRVVQVQEQERPHQD